MNMMNFNSIFTILRDRWKQISQWKGHCYLGKFYRFTDSKYNKLKMETQSYKKQCIIYNLINNMNI